MDSSKLRSRANVASGRKKSDDFYFPVAVSLPSGPPIKKSRKISPRQPLDIHDMFASLPVTSHAINSKELNDNYESLAVVPS